MVIFFCGKQQKKPVVDARGGNFPMKYFGKRGLVLEKTCFKNGAMLRCFFFDER